MPTQLTPEDALRLNVLLAKEPSAIRVDESKMMIHALLDGHETSFKLNPVGKDEAYLKSIRETLSSHVLRSPSGHPIYLRRWMRMEQERSKESLQKLLLLGESEALAAVAYAENLSVEVARHAWWVEPKAEYARQMLRRESIVQSDLGLELASFLVEFLPFEEKSNDIIESVRLVLQGNLINDEMRKNLWDKGKRKPVYYVGFLLETPKNLPVTAILGQDFDKIQTVLQQLAEDEPIKKILPLFGPDGYKFLSVFATVLSKPLDQEVVIALFHALRIYFRHTLGLAEMYCQSCGNIEEVKDMAKRLCAENLLTALQQLEPHQQASFEAALALAQIDVPLLNPVFGLTDAIGSVMRKKIEHLSTPIMQWLKIIHPSIR